MCESIGFVKIILWIDGLTHSEEIHLFFNDNYTAYAS